MEMGVSKYIRPRFALAVLKNIVLKIKYGSSIDIDLFRTYIGSGAVIVMNSGGQIRFRRGRRIYVSAGCELRASGGVLDIGAGVFFNRNCNVVAHDSVLIGPECMFGPGAAVYDADHALNRLDIPFHTQGYKVAPVELGFNVWLGSNSIVTRGTRIGASTVVGAGSLVRGELSSGCVYAGSPARLIRKLDDSAM